MVPRWRNALTTQSLRCSREPVMVLRRVYVSRPITFLAAASRRTVNIFGRRRPGPCRERIEGPQGRNGSVNPLVLRRRTTITKPLVKAVSQTFRVGRLALRHCLQLSSPDVVRVCPWTSMYLDVRQCMSMYFNWRQMYVSVRHCTHPMASTVSDDSSVLGSMKQWFPTIVAAWPWWALSHSKCAVEPLGIQCIILT